VGELPDALGAVLRDEDCDLAQPLRSLGSGRGAALVHQRAAADKARHQYSRRLNRIGVKQTASAAPEAGGVGANVPRAGDRATENTQKL
jgi:hypothetical protein